MLEFSANKIAIHLAPTDILIAHDWKVVHLIRDTNQFNIDKHWIALLPDFNENTFPFIVFSGNGSFNLVNVKDAHMDVLIQIETRSDRGQEGAFFIRERDGFDMHFTTFQNIAGQRIENWHCMQFRNDFAEVLQKYGRLPISSYEAQLELFAELRKGLSESNMT